MFEYILKWAGCMDFLMAQALWQSCYHIVENAPTFYLPYDLLIDTFYPDGAPTTLAYMNAFTTAFGLTFAIIEIEEVPIPVWIMNNPVQWYASAPYVLSFPEGLIGAPCTQQIFP